MKSISNVKAVIAMGLLVSSVGAFAKGGGGCCGTRPVASVLPTFAPSAIPNPIKAGYRVLIGMGATAASNIPLITLDSAPVGFVIESQAGFVSAGEIGNVGASVFWTPARDQIGSQSAIFRATVPAGSTTLQQGYTVIDAPQPVTNLVALKSGGQITISWSPAVGGVDPLTFVVTACYPTGFAQTRSNSAIKCDKFSTAAVEMSIPSTPPNPVLAPTFVGIPSYNSVSVTPIDAVGTGVGTNFGGPSLDVVVAIP